MSLADELREMRAEQVQIRDRYAPSGTGLYMKACGAIDMIDAIAARVGLDVKPMRAVRVSENRPNDIHFFFEEWLKLPADQVAQIRHIDLERPADDEMVAMREQALDRIAKAMGIDPRTGLPVEPDPYRDNPDNAPNDPLPEGTP